MLSGTEWRGDFCNFDLYPLRFCEMMPKVNELHLYNTL